MKSIILLLLLSMTIVNAGFFNNEEKAQKKYEDEKNRLCQMFTQKSLNYAKDMRGDELSRVTLESYKKRKHIFCSQEEEKKISKVEEKVKETPQYIKDISREDVRLCKIFQDKEKRYKKNMREDELAYSTLKSYQKRAYIFCSQEELDAKA